MLDETDYGVGYEWVDDGDVLLVNHLWIDPEHRGQGHGSFVLETIVRMAYYEGAECVEVSIGSDSDGATEAFLRENGFHILRIREYDDEWKEYVDPEYGVDAVRRV